MQYYLMVRTVAAQWYLDSDGSSIFTPDIQFTTNVFHSFFHVSDTILKRKNVVVIEAFTIVFYGEDELVSHLDSKIYSRSIGMFCNIGEAFFDDHENVSSVLATYF